MFDFFKQLIFGGRRDDHRGWSDPPHAPQPASARPSRVELEAILVSVQSSLRNKRGEVEYERSRSGDVKCEIEIEASPDTPVGAEVAVLIAGVEVCRAVITNPKTEAVLHSANGDTIPPAAAGDAVEVTHKGQVVLRGQFRHD